MNESAIRSIARRNGMSLEKGRSAPARHCGEAMQYRVVDTASNCVLLGGHINGYGCSLEECADFIRRCEGQCSPLAKVGRVSAGAPEQELEEE